ncbi:hypothetical protein [Polymorphospora sp. NPDC050346]|uniref:hypothetical protein n=1 Tax=Polymorphospora sp. NPDC050346 TaxID=3155780 RepID=UPI00340576F8
MIDVRAERIANRIEIVLDSDEAMRLAACLTEATVGLSRAEFFIRTGCAREDVDSLGRKLVDIARGDVGTFSADLPEGDEQTENPRRPRR